MQRCYVVIDERSLHRLVVCDAAVCLPILVPWSEALVLANLGDAAEVMGVLHGKARVENRKVPRSVLHLRVRELRLIPPSEHRH